MIWWLKKTLLRFKLYCSESFENEAESLIIWYAISFAFGSAFYFVFPLEIPTWLIVTYLELVLVLLYIYKNHNAPFKVLTYVLLFALGLCVAKANTLYQARNIEQNLNKTSYLNGKIKVLDYNYRNKPRLTLTDVNNFDRSLKGDFKISILKKESWMKEGKCVELIANIPTDFTPNPIGNYNQEFNNFYKDISYVGYSVSPVFEKDCKTKENYFKTKINSIRNYIKQKVTSKAKKENASIITALLIGDRSLITKEQNQNYRTSGLAHFLSISGMHMSIIALLVFFLVRNILLLFSHGEYDLRKPASIISIIITFLYFLISGQSVSCIRAFVMTSMILLAILLNRRAITLRLWAFSLMIVIIITPNAVISPGFLMSFSATLGLIAYYEQKAPKIHNWLLKQSKLKRLFSYILGIALTDLVASLMTLPYSMYYFNQIAIYTTLANVLSAPIITFFVMPSLLIYMFSLPLGLSEYVMPLLEESISVINHITIFVSNLPYAGLGANINIINKEGLFILTLGLLWLCIWKEKWRKLGLVFIILGLSSGFFMPSTDFIFDAKGTTYAYKNNQDQIELSPWHKNKFLSRMWTNKETLPKNKNFNTDYITCTKEKCIYKNRIEFQKQKLKLDGKDVPLKNGGYIDLKRGTIHYYHKQQNRLWNKKY